VCFSLVVNVVSRYDGICEYLIAQMETCIYKLQEEAGRYWGVYSS
jgi:hypothetical protein